MSESRRVLTASFGYPHPERPGRMLFTHEQAKALMRQGAEVLALDLDAPSGTGRDRYDGVVTERLALPRGIRASPRAALRSFSDAHRVLRDLVRSWGPDLVLLSFVEHKYLPLWTSFGADPRTRRAFTAHGVDVLGAGLALPHRLIRSALLRRADFIFAVSPATATLAADLRGKRGPEVSVVENGVDHPKLERALRIDAEAHRLRLGWPSDRPVVLSVANLVPRKGLDLVLRAGALVAPHHDFLHVIIGRGPERGALEVLADRLGVADRVRIVDAPLDDETLAGAFVACDVFALASRTLLHPPGMEGFGVVYAEASYAGKPVLGGRSGGVPSVVEHGVTGFLIDPDGPAAVLDLAAHLGRLLDDPELRTQLGRAGRARARARFDWDRNAREVLKLTAP